MGRWDAVFVAERLEEFFAKQIIESDGSAQLEIRPKLAGCGWIDAAEADVLFGNTLYEVKAGERHFRMTDLRQLLCYCALNFSSKQYEIRNAALINPRFGTLIRDELDSLCQQIAGASSADVLGEIISYISEPFSRYQSI